ncbi:MAG: class I SAM-dependent methyltransferase [Lachnospiraceae bacterium]|nr:class I SAM-dependent methyltransferase [Lachnospiraceae bacterium]
METQTNRIVEKNKQSWDDFSELHMKYNHSEKILRPILDDPAEAFPRPVWEQLRRFVPELRGKRVCVPSSGDNLAVYAFALLGAVVTSCDISEKQLEAARRTAERIGLGETVRFVCADTMRLEGLEDEAYDLVYTSNGVHVWLNDLPAMYRSVYRILKPGGISLWYDVHPFTRPFDDRMKVIKPYDLTGPFEDEYNVNFLWRVQDLLNAVMDAGLLLAHIEEIMPEKDDKHPFWISNEELVNGVEISREELDRMYDPENNPRAALPAWLCAVGRRP